MQRSSTLLNTSLSRCLARPTVLRRRAPKPFPRKARQYLQTNGPSESDSSKSSSPTGSEAAKEDVTPSHKPILSDPDPTLPIVEYDTRRGRVRRHVRVSAKTNAQTLTAAMSGLLTAHMSALKSTQSVGSKGWDLESDGAAINRFFAFENEADSTMFIDSVRTAADEMDHHPEISTSADRRRQDNPVMRYVMVSCSTHRPPGLSMRDVRLARRIDEIAEAHNYMAKNVDARTRVLIAIRRDLARQLRHQRGWK